MINDAKFTNSVNTIFLDDTNTLVGENTDVFGIQGAYLKEIVQVENKKALVAYLVAGDPDIETTVSLIKLLVDSGADIIEIGVPFKHFESLIIA